MNDARRIARTQLHIAAQVPCAVGRTHAEPSDDDGHTTLTWEGDVQTLLCQPLKDSPDRIGLRLPDLTLVWVDADGVVAAELPLPGQTLDDAYGFARDQLKSRGLSSDLDMVAGYELGPTRQGDGAPFDVLPPDDLEWFATLYRIAADTLAAARSGLEGASGVRCWPHHFDVAVLHPLRSGDPEARRSLGFGFSPGDDSYDDPYWYVTPWPYPSADDLPTLSSGKWHTQQWVGAVLPAAGVDSETACDFVVGAHTSLRRLMGTH